MAVPANKPITLAPAELTMSQPAVIPTNPAKVPFSVKETSGFLYLIQDTIKAASVPVAAAILVLTSTFEATSIVSSPVIEVVEPPLNPNQENQRIKTPKAARVRL